MVGRLIDGQEYKIDIEDYDRIKDHYCYPNGSQIGIRDNGKRYQLSHYIMMEYKESFSKCFFRTGDKYDFRKTNLYTGNEYILRGSYYEVFDLHYNSFLIDASDRDLVEKYWWNVDVNGYVICARGNNGKAMKLHRYLFSIVDNLDSEIDHINRITTDNRRCNLRIATRSENCINRNLQHLNKSGIIGVYRHSDYSDKWCAQLNIEGKRLYLGMFNSKDEAAQARKEAEKKYFTFPH